VLLGVTALFGYMAITAGIHTQSASAVVPMLFVQMFPQWFVGMAFAAIAIGALVPAAIMSIAAANLFTRSIYKEYINPACSGTEETRVARFASLAMKAGALLFVLFLPAQFAIYLQLLAGAWILQTFPIIVMDGDRVELHADDHAAFRRHCDAGVHRPICAYFQPNRHSALYLHIRWSEDASRP
jgi:SSS family solute:Na+ symporter